MTENASQAAIAADPAQLYATRLKRAQDCIALRQPDAVPIMLSLGNLAADLEGITRQELMEDADKADRALLNAAHRFQPDFALNVLGNPAMSRILGDKMTRWPGFQLEPNQSFQFAEEEFMKAEDYDAFIEDPGDWCIRKYLPRAFSALEGLALLPRFGMAGFGFYGLSQNIGTLSIPPVKASLEALMKAAEVQMAVNMRMGQSMQTMAAAGFPFPPIFGPTSEAPFDFMSDTLRGMRGIFMDIRRNPDKLLAAQEKVISIQFENTVNCCRAMGVPISFFPLHRGADGFISLANFEKFYWPQLKRYFLMLIDAGITPVVFWEGCWDQRLKYLAELPKGKTVGWFQSTDLIKAKEVLGDVMCIIGGMRVSMLNSATPAEIREHTKRMCQEVGKGGGFIMSTDIIEMEGSRPENVQAWVDATREFGQY